MALTKPHSFVAGTSAQSSQVNADFDALFNAIGSQEYTERNYIANDQTVTASLNALDMNLKDLSDTVSGVVTSQTFGEAASLPSTISNQMKLFVAEGNSSLESVPSFARENNGGEARIILGDANSKFWLYRNDAAPGMVIDTSVTDRVLAIKGGSAAYNVNGGNEAGAWTHLHTVGSHTHTYSGSVSSTGTATGSHTHTATVNAGSGTSSAVADDRALSTEALSLTVTASGSYSGTTGSGSGNTGSTTDFRPYAAVGTLQFPDVST